MNSKKHDEEHWTMKCETGRQEKQLKDGATSWANSRHQQWEKREKKKGEGLQ